VSPPVTQPESPAAGAAAGQPESPAAGAAAGQPESQAAGAAAGQPASPPAGTPRTGPADLPATAPHDPDCLFCRIAAGTIPAHVVAESDRALAFMDLHPIRPGHVLVIPRAHHVWFEDLPPPEAAAVMALSQAVARALKSLHRVERVALFFTGIHVPHAHAHLVPMHHRHDVTSTAYLGAGVEGYTLPPRLPEAEMAALAAALRAELAEAPGAGPGLGGAAPRRPAGAAPRDI